jgi:hypothetical protein
MSHRAWLLSLVLAGVAVCSWAEEGKPGAQKAAENTQTWVGQLGRSSQAMAGLSVRAQEKGGKHLNLLLFAKQGDTETRKTLMELLTMKPLPYASVTGILAPDGKRVLVTAISKAEPPKKKKGGKKAKN